MFFRYLPLILLLPCAALATGKAPALKYLFQGSEEGTTAESSPFVTIDNILPQALLKTVHDEIYDNTDDANLCVARRDGLDCDDERWLDFTLEQAKNGEYFVDDIFEQVVAEISMYDLMYVLPEHIASKVVGVSWRVLTSYSGYAAGSFHYDSDEAIDYSIDQVPVMHPLLSTVTYLTNYGEPTLIYEQALVEHLNETHPNDDHLMPRAAYVVMPAANKHLAFDPRLLHGSYSNISKYPGNEDNWRIVIGTNFHTHHSMETQNDQRNAIMDEDELVEALTGDELDGEEESPAYFNVWDPKNLIKVEEREAHNFSQWESFELELARDGMDICQHLAPCRITVRLPTQQILAQEYDPNFANGADFGFEITPEDYVISPDLALGAKEEVEKTRDEQMMQKLEQNVDLAVAMLKMRCEMYDHDILAMNPPLLHDFCDTIQEYVDQGWGVDLDREYNQDDEEDEEDEDDEEHLDYEDDDEDDEEHLDYEDDDEEEDEEDEIPDHREEVSIGEELQNADSMHSGVASEL